jgi:TolB-like protein/tetratricopeptide (TPR) repeat protein
MGEVSPERVATPAGAVFLSYASQDAAAAERLCASLRAAGIEVWFDQSELRGGDAWDQSIRKQIKTCALFIPIISKNTHERAEGYFRLEWKLAVDRSHLIMANKAFLVPVVIDDTADDDENVPDKFREVQWTRLPCGETQPEFAARIKRLLSPDPPITARLSAGVAPGCSPIPLAERTPSTLSRAVPVAVVLLCLAVLAYLLFTKPWLSKPTVPPVTSKTTSPAPTAVFAPPPHSIAVLPFVNLSGEANQQYFSDGLTEELLNSLSRIKELQVAARTSSFSFQGEHPDIATVAHKLNVGTVLEGSVRRSAHTIRITTQLVNGVTGFHLWSRTYDRDLGDVLKLQTEIATAVASALKVTLLGYEVAEIEVGETHNPDALDAYLRATKASFGPLPIGADEETGCEAWVAGYTEAIRLDSNYALAYAARSIARQNCANTFATTPSARHASIDYAQADATKATVLAPDLSEGHLALAIVYRDRLEFVPASEEYERALVLGPGNVRVLRNYGQFAALMGRGDSGLAALHRAVALDPLNPNAHGFLGDGLSSQRRYAEALRALQDALALDPDRPSGFSTSIGEIHYLLGDLESARSACEEDTANTVGEAHYCLAMVYDKLGRHADAATMMSKLRPKFGDTWAVAYSLIYAQWGDTARALDWLETAMRLRSPDLILLRTSQLLDPLRNEPRFQTIERELKFAD